MAPKRPLEKEKNSKQGSQKRTSSNAGTSRATPPPRRTRSRTARMSLGKSSRNTNLPSVKCTSQTDSNFVASHNSELNSNRATEPHVSQPISRVSRYSFHSTGPLSDNEVGTERLSKSPVRSCGIEHQNQNPPNPYRNLPFSSNDTLLSQIGASGTGLSLRSLPPSDDKVTVRTDSSVKSTIRSRYKADTLEFLQLENWENAPPLLFGIDFGTSNTVVSFVSTENPHAVKVWKNDNSDELWPSVVRFTSSGMLLGRKALIDCANDLKNIVTNVKGFLGRPYEHAHVQNLMTRKPFSIVRANSENSQCLEEPGSEECSWGQVLFRLPALELYFMKAF